MRRRNNIKGRVTGIMLSVVMTVSSVYIPAYAETPDESEPEAVVSEITETGEEQITSEDMSEAADEENTENETGTEAAEETADESGEPSESVDEAEEIADDAAVTEEGVPDALTEQDIAASDTELQGGSNDGDFTFDSSNVLTEYTGTGGDVVIPAKTTKIASNVFQNIESITSVTFAGTKCKEIGYSAFSGCSSLRSVTIPDTVTIIGSRAFYHTDLSEIVLPSGLTDMGSGVFEGNSNLKKVTVNSKITSDPDADCFKDCKIESIIFGSSVNGIAVNLFNNATFADGFSLTVPDGILTIGESAFYGSNISGIRFTSGSKLKEIGTTAFLGCTGIKELTLPASVQKIGRGAFAGNDLTEITLPAGLREISLGAFKSNTGLSRVTLNSTDLTVNDAVDNDVFDKCKISEIRFGDDVTVIPARLFRKAGFEDDTVVTIPANIKEIGYNAFSDTTIAGVSFAAGSKLEVIGEGAFYNCSGIEAIELPASLKTIHKNAFCNNSLAEITIPASVTKIESEAFLNNTGLKKVTVNSENIELDTYPAAVFGGCQVENIVFGPDVTKIPAYLFRNSKFADGFELVVPAGITSIGAGAFDFDTTVESTLYGLSFEDGSMLASIGNRAFYGCKYIEEVSLPETVTYIGESAFSGCDLKKVVIPSRVSFLGSSAFEKNTELAEVDIRTDKIIDKNYNRYGVFLECRIGKITLCDSMPYIPNGLFDNCGMKKDTSVVIPSSVTSIHKNAFGTCKNLTDIYMGSNVKEMVEDPFSYGYSISNNGSKDLTFHAPAGSYAIRWAKEHGYKTAEITVYKVTYNLNGGTNAPGNASEYVEGKGFDLQDPVKKGNSFEGWYTTSDCAEGTKITRIEGDKNITVYAKWKADIAETSVSVSPAGGILYLGESMLLTATVLPDNATHKDVTWTSSDTAIATIKDNGDGTATVLPVANGSVKITVMTKGIGNKSATCNITVDTKVTSIKLVDPNTGNNSGKMQPGKTLQLKPVFNEGVSEPTDKSLIWVSSNAAVASVSSTGKITAKSAGTVEISANKGREVESEYFVVNVYEPITKITLNKSKLTLGDGDTYDLDVVIPDHIADQSYVWSTSDELIAQVDTLGKVTAHLPDGFSSATATVKATAPDGSGTYATCKITVGVPIESIDINVPKSLKYNINGIPCVAVGKSVKLSAVFNPMSPANKNLVWSSSDESVAKVDAKGNVKALSPGSVTITAMNTESSKGKGISLYVYAPLKKLALNEKKLSIKQGDTFDLETVMTPADATFSVDGITYETPKVTWASSDDSIVTVNNGKITALNLGDKDKASVKITASATSDGNITKTAVCNVTVYADDVKISKIGLSKTKLTIGSNAKTRLSAKITPASATNRELEWSSDNEPVASVSEDGTITAHSAGTAVITVSAKDGSSKKATCKVTVGNPATEINIKAPERLAVGKTFVLKAEIKSGTGKAANKEYTWINDTPDLINIDKKGKVTVKGVGKAKITIKAEPVTDEAERVTKEISFDTYIPVSKLSAEKTKFTMFEGDSGYELHYIIANYDLATNKDIKWTSSNSDIVMISDRRNSYAGEKVTNEISVYIKALKPGTARITGITTDGSNKKVTVTVKVLGVMHYEDVGIKVTSQPKKVTVTNNETKHVEVKNLQVKKTFKIVPMLTKTATDKTVTYYSMDSLVATVSKTGVVTAKRTGSTKVYMYTSDGGYNGYVEVTVVK